MNARRALGHLHSFTREITLATLEETGHMIQHEHDARTWDGLRRNLRSPMNLSLAATLGMAPDTGHKLLGGFSHLVITKAG